MVKYPPMMMIKKNADGTMSYRGVSFDILNYIGKALDIRFSIFFHNFCIIFSIRFFFKFFLYFYVFNNLLK